MRSGTHAGDTILSGEISRRTRPARRLSSGAGAGRRLGVGKPLPVAQNLVWQEARFVVHFVALLDPVTQVHMRQAEPPRLLDLPQDAEGSVAGIGVGLVE